MEEIPSTLLQDPKGTHTWQPHQTGALTNCSVLNNVDVLQADGALLPAVQRPDGQGMQGVAAACSCGGIHAGDAGPHQLQESPSGNIPCLQAQRLAGVPPCSVQAAAGRSRQVRHGHHLEVTRQPAEQAKGSTSEIVDGTVLNVALLSLQNGAYEACGLSKPARLKKRASTTQSEVLVWPKKPCRRHN